MKAPDPFLTSAGKILGPIKGYTSLIQDDSKPGSNTRWWADKIMRDVESLERRLECTDMLTLECAAAERTSWRHVIARALAPIRNLETQARVEVYNEASSHFVERRALLARSLFQVIRNACEASADDGRVSVRVTEEGDKASDGTIFHVIVEDEGPGIPREKIENVRLPFVSTKSGHHGLGLPYVESVAREIGMGVKIESRMGGGTKVTMKLRVQGDRQ